MFLFVADFLLNSVQKKSLEAFLNCDYWDVADLTPHGSRAAGRTGDLAYCEFALGELVCGELRVRASIAAPRTWQLSQKQHDDTMTSIPPAIAVQPLCYPHHGQLVQLLDGRRAVVNESLPASGRAWRLLLVDSLEYELVTVANFVPVLDAAGVFVKAPFDNAANCLPPRLTVEAARSGRTSCVRCCETVASGQVRVRVEWMHSVYGRFVKVTQWFHVLCFDPHCGRVAVEQIDVSSLSANDVATVSALWQRREADVPPFRPPVDTVDDVVDIRMACRSAVHQQIEAFRSAGFAGDGERKCPYSGLDLEPSVTHVHHQGESTKPFNDLVSYFQRLHPEASTAQTSFTGFVDRRFAALFSRLHARFAHLQLVHKTANLGLLKTSARPKTVCDRCANALDAVHVPEFRAWWCSSCRLVECISQDVSVATYALEVADLQALPFATLPCPVNQGIDEEDANVVATLLFRRADIEALCVQRHGSLEIATRKRPRAHAMLESTRIRRRTRRFVEIV
jgi:hypothetical protein